MKKLLSGYLMASCLVSSFALAQQSSYRVEVVAEGLEHPWSVAFLPDGRMLVTERPGRLRLVGQDGSLSPPIQGLPAMLVSGQAGLFDVLLAEDFAASGTIFLSFAHGDIDANHTRIIRAQLADGRLNDIEVIFTAEPAKSGDAHFGGRMAWLPDGTLIFGTGDGFYFRESAQQLDSHVGKIIRINADGSVPADNPFVSAEDVRPEIYSYGHRHVQAIVPDPVSGIVYAHEHGPRGGDELNAIESGNNYGWPAISYGLDYSKALITPFTAKEGMAQPLFHWTPSIAPGGMALYRHELFPAWNDSLFVAAMAEQSVRRVPLSSLGAMETQEVLFQDLGKRMRDVRVGPEGALYLLTDEPDGQLLRVTPQVQQVTTQ